jgi:hypothetical protein
MFFFACELCNKTNRLITNEGEILAAGKPGFVDSELVGAIVMNIWSCYQKFAADLNFILVDCEVCSIFLLLFLVSLFPSIQKRKRQLTFPQNGRLAVSKVSQFILCVYGDSRAEFGMLKLKVREQKQFCFHAFFFLILTSFLFLQVEAISKYLEEPLSKIVL